MSKGCAEVDVTSDETTKRKLKTYSIVCYRSRLGKLQQHFCNCPEAEAMKA